MKKIEIQRGEYTLEVMKTFVGAWKNSEKKRNIGTAVAFRHKKDGWKMEKSKDLELEGIGVVVADIAASITSRGWAAVKSELLAELALND